jgi:hypothetical protein
VDYFLPLDQPNLDFLIEAPLEEFFADKKSSVSIVVGTVFLNPIKPAMIVSSIKVQIIRADDLQFEFVDIPIIASVVNHTQLFSVVDS